MGRHFILVSIFICCFFARTLTTDQNEKDPESVKLVLRKLVQFLVPQMFFLFFTIHPSGERSETRNPLCCKAFNLFQWIADMTRILPVWRAGEIFEQADPQSQEFNNSFMAGSFSICWRYSH